MFYYIANQFRYYIEYQPMKNCLRNTCWLAVTNVGTYLIVRLSCLDFTVENAVYIEKRKKKRC